ncbi:MAG: hypothetical protein AAFN74_00820, partial [Myxococcota bacterium]
MGHSDQPKDPDGLNSQALAADLEARRARRTALPQVPDHPPGLNDRDLNDDGFDRDTEQVPPRFDPGASPLDPRAFDPADIAADIETDLPMTSAPRSAAVYPPVVEASPPPIPPLPSG